MQAAARRESGGCFEVLRIDAEGGEGVEAAGRVDIEDAINLAGDGADESAGPAGPPLGNYARIGGRA